MSQSIPNPPPGFDDLSVDEKIEYVQSLWDRIAATDEQVPMPEWHRRVIADRMREFAANPDAGRPWEAVRDELRRRLSGESPD